MKKLRGHHIFCAALFQGCGYDETFTACMEKTLKELSAGEYFMLCRGSDDLCAACPHRMEGGGCALGTADVARRDEAAFSALGQVPEKALTFSQIGEKLREIEKQQWESVCKDCRWQRKGLCSWELFQKLSQERFV